MARKRMFDIEIVDTDLFLEMPQSTQNLYFHLGMRADDDGFVSNPKKIIRTIGANNDDLKILITKKFIIPFESGVIVIRHWKINNYLRKDRYTETLYKEEKRLLTEDENGVYNIGIPNNNQKLTDGTHSKEEKRKEKNSKDKNNKEQLESDSCCNGFQENDSCMNGFQKVSKFYEENINLLTPYTSKVLEDYTKELGSELVIYAMQLAVEANVRTIKYIKVILNNWSKANIRTLLEAKNESKIINEKKDNSKKIKAEDVEEIDTSKLTEDEYLKLLRGKKENAG